VNHFADPAFWKAYRALPKSIQKRADKSFSQLISNPSHNSLHFKPVGRYWSVRVSRDYRAVAIKDGGDCIWFWIGSHTEYDKLIM